MKQNLLLAALLAVTFNAYASERYQPNGGQASSNASAPSLTQNVICPIITPNSNAVQFLVFGGSTTGTQSLNAICVAYQLGQHEVVERMACNADAAYRKANPNCGEYAWRPLKQSVLQLCCLNL